MQTSPVIPTTTDTPECETNAQPSKRRISRSKDELAYWKAAIRRVPDSPYWYAELQRGGIRRKVSLETSNKAAAAHRARELWYEVRAHGWQAYLAKYKPESLPAANPSVGAFIAAVEKSADLKGPTLRSYLSALRKITSDIALLSDDSSRYGHGKGRKAWLSKVNDIKLSVLSAENIQSWKRAFLAQAAQDPISQRSAKVSVNSFLRCAKSLFSPRILAHIKLELPSPLPFAGCQFEPRPSSKYRSTFDIAALVRSATEALASSDPEAYKVFLLASMVGLRRKEIDLLEWSAFRWEAGTIRIETTEHFAAKSEDSLGDVAVDSQVMDVFRGYLSAIANLGEQSSFVIESPEQPRTVNYNYYRCQETFARLIDWLRSQGVRSLKPLHTLRKEFGSEVCRHFGIYAASAALRHSDIKVTCQYYVQDRTRATVGLGHLLESKVVPFKEVA